MSAYRDEIEALRARAEAAEQELAKLRARPASTSPSGLSLLLPPNDRVLWHGRPMISRLVLRWLPLSAFGLLWLLFFLGVVAASFAGPRVLLAPFAAIGVWLLLCPLREARRASGVRYAVTEHEAIIIIPAAFTASVEVRRFARWQLGHLVVRHDPDGGGDVIFETRPVAPPLAGIRRDVDVGFIGLRDVAPAEAALRELLRAGARAAPSRTATSE